MNRFKIFWSIFVLGICLNPNISYAQKRSEYWHQRVSHFEKLGVKSSDIVFIGNSITDGCELSELFDNPNIKNRGINSDDICGITERIGSVLEGRPSKIFLLIGINDISHDLSLSEMTEMYESLVAKIKDRSPETQLYILSVMPVNNDFNRYKRLIGKEKVISQLNNNLKQISERYKIDYIDLWDALIIPGTNKLNSKYTNDGLHLIGEGYEIWRDCIKPFI